MRRTPDLLLQLGVVTPPLHYDNRVPRNDYFSREAPASSRSTEAEKVSLRLVRRSSRPNIRFECGAGV